MVAPFFNSFFKSIFPNDLCPTEAKALILLIFCCLDTATHVYAFIISIDFHCKQALCFQLFFYNYQLLTFSVLFNMSKLNLLYTIMKIKTTCIKNYRSNFPNIWIFLDEDRIVDELAFLKLLPSAKFIGIVVRTKNKKPYIKKLKLISKICRMKKI